MFIYNFLANMNALFLRTLFNNTPNNNWIRSTKNVCSNNRTMHSLFRPSNIAPPFTPICDNYRRRGSVKLRTHQIYSKCFTQNSQLIQPNTRYVANIAQRSRPSACRGARINRALSPQPSTVPCRKVTTAFLTLSLPQSLANMLA